MLYTIYVYVEFRELIAPDFFVNFFIFLFLIIVLPELQCKIKLIWIKLFIISLFISQCAA